MNNYKELIYKIRGAAARWEEEHPRVGVGQMRYCDALRDAAGAIEQLCTDVARLEAENRAKEQYIAETIGKVTKERDAAIADLHYQSACWNCTKNGKDCHANIPMEQPNVMCGGFEWRGERRRE